jgi:hypothetical protein
MGFQLKRAPSVATDDFVETVGKKKAPVVGGDGNILFGQVVAIEVGNHMRSLVSFK